MSLFLSVSSLKNAEKLLETFFLNDDGIHHKKTHRGPRKTIKCLLGLQLFWLVSSECESPELLFGAGANTDGIRTATLRVNKLGLELFNWLVN